MATIQTPTQTRYLEPYKQKVFQFDSEYSNVFLSRYTNNILKVFGDDCILDGLDIEDLTNTNTDISFTVTLGSGIQDLTFFEFSIDTTVTFANLNLFPDTNKVLVYLTYQYLETPIENPILLKTAIYNPTTHVVVDSFVPTTDRILLGLIGYTIVGGNINTVTLEQTDGSLNIDGVYYTVRKQNENTVQVLDGGLL